MFEDSNGHPEPVPRRAEQQAESAVVSVNGAGETQPVEHIAQFFTYRHLHPVLQPVASPFADLAAHILTEIPRNPERTVALRKLLEAKDAAVRAILAKV